MFRLPSFGPFKSAAEAGAAIDRLTDRFPTASFQMLMPGEARTRATSEAEHAKEYKDGQWRLEAILGEAYPFSVIETLPGGVRDAEPVDSDVELLAEHYGFPASELGIIEAERSRTPVWIVCRVHMETSDPKKAETAALWRRNAMREDEQTVVVVKMPIRIPAATRCQDRS